MSLKIGIPRGIYYYYYGDLIKNFFKELNIKTIVSNETNQEIINEGIKYSNDEMCLSLKILLGHVSSLKDKCDFLIVPRIDNFGKKEQTCTNFLGIYDLINNLFDIKILDMNIDYLNKDTEKKAFIKLGRKLNKSYKESLNAYLKALKQTKMTKENKIITNLNNLNSNQTKILLVAHPYNLYDYYIGKPIIEYLEKLNVTVIYSDLFNEKNNADKYCPGLYWKYSKENISSIDSCFDKIDGIIFISAFPCGLDSLVNELVLRKIQKPAINIIVDNNDSLTGLETRLESFVDILEQ